MGRNLLRLLVLLVMCCKVIAGPGNSPLKPPAPEVIAEAREIVQTMRQSERGPYSRIRWFCNDGSVQAPEAYACRERGGGRQHAEYSAARERLAALGWHVGTIFAALRWEEIWSDDERKTRLRELPLERYMVDFNDGWVLQHARNYRGHIQLEDEEAAGRERLLKLLAQQAWTRDNLLLVRELVRTIPHGGRQDRTQTVRRLAQELADQDAGFGRLRIEIHSRPDARSADRVREWLAARPGLQPALREQLNRLSTGLDELYGAAGRAARLAGAEQALAQTVPDAAKWIRQARATRGADRIESLSRAMVALRAQLPVADPGTTLYRIGVLQALETELRVAASEWLATPGITRTQFLQQAIHLLNAAWAGAWLSEGERDALLHPLQALLDSREISAQDYALAVRRLSLAAAWATQSVRYTFGEPLVRYVALDEAAGRFVDELLRGSVLLPLGEIAHWLAMDGAAAAGLSHYFFGQTTGQLLGLNPGVARSRLRVLDMESLTTGVQPDSDEIVVLPETVAELAPVAGILTLGEGNPLSHVQMLARNLGIPNAVVGPGLLPRLRSLDGQRVLLAVAADGRVYIESLERVPEALRTAAQDQANASPDRVRAPKPTLESAQPLVLAQLHAGLSGKVIGPKAANVGELARRFPGQVPAAVALPFAAFANHTRAQRTRIALAYQQHREGSLSQAALEAVLDSVRAEVAALRLEDALRAPLLVAMRTEFGEGPDYGVFVRSDTNVEDLPEFTGAGLNETVPNVVGRDAQIDAISRVWASVYSRRAMAWRARILEDPEQVFASVLLMKSIAAEKSGVLVTSDLGSGGQGLTVSVARGVGGAVDNESAASLVLRADGTSLLLAEAKAPYQRVLQPAGGVHWVPAASGAVLSHIEQQALRTLAEQVKERYPPVFDKQGQALPWDIEFAFSGGRLWLLQIRPLVQRGQAQAARLMNQLLPLKQPVGHVDLSQQPAATEGVRQ